MPENVPEYKAITLGVFMNPSLKDCDCTKCKNFGTRHLPHVTIARTGVYFNPKSALKGVAPSVRGDSTAWRGDAGIMLFPFLTPGRCARVSIRRLQDGEIVRPRKNAYVVNAACYYDGGMYMGPGDAPVERYPGRTVGELITENPKRPLNLYGWWASVCAANRTVWNRLWPEHYDDYDMGKIGTAFRLRVRILDLMAENVRSRLNVTKAWNQDLTKHTIPLWSREAKAYAARVTAWAERRSGSMFSMMAVDAARDTSYGWNRHIDMIDSLPDPIRQELTARRYR